ncbi:hypothetical protein MD535_01755 [Vibrio sp. ZSDZ65]|uniref:Uncharacterized protein n=1 Tax=Vibrio qingdaonensis TaxID=2829491 RepID=A0A9X3HUZ1_9VIBR|nr:hypothetical protein [Vibrio qingdaonensis]MCW8344751.1 hypothetical protein [Vibrio qingdaonensis]
MIMIRAFFLILVLTFNGLMVCNFANAAVQDVDLRIFSKPTLLAGNGRYKQAAEQYHRLSIQILASESKLGTEKMWQYAGLAEVLATVCANLDNDAKAYEYWANSVRYLLTGGTDWAQMQQYLHQQNEQANTQLLTQMQTIDVAGGYDQSWEQDAAVLQVWQEKLNLFVFSGPRAGMAVSPSALTIQPQVRRPASPVPAQVAPGQRKLNGLESNFSQSSSFVPTEVTPVVAVESKDTEATAESVSTSSPTLNIPRTNRHLIQGTISPQPVVTGNEVTIATPIEAFDYEQAETAHNERSMPKVTKDEGQQPEVASQLQKANIGTETNQGVQAIQRRSFAPITE